MRRIGAVLAGFGANLLAVPVDAVMHAAKLFPSPGQPLTDGSLAIALLYRALFAVLGAWVTARLAPPHLRTRLPWVLGGLGVVLSGLGAAAQWELGHHWYPLSLIAVCLPATWAGISLFTRSNP